MYEKDKDTKKVIIRAINLISRGKKIPEAKLNEIVKYLQEKYSKLNCCVLWERDYELTHLLRKAGIDIGNQEVIIGEWGSLRYSEKYVNIPTSI